MTGQEIIKAIHDQTPDNDGSTLHRLCGPNADEVIAALAGVLAAFAEGRFSPFVLTHLCFNIGAFCADHGLASTIPEIQERRKS